MHPQFLFLVQMTIKSKNLTRATPIFLSMASLYLLYTKTPNAFYTDNLQHIHMHQGLTAS